MEPKTEREIAELGEQLRARHDDSVIADTIGLVDTLDGKNHRKTGEILRIMADTEN